MGVRYSQFAGTVRNETAFSVLAAAKQLKAMGKRVIELEIGDSPFPSTANAKRAGIEAILSDASHYTPSVGIPALREACADYLRREHGVPATAANIVVGPGAKIFELLFCEAFLDPGDGVPVFTPHFPTYPANIERRGARVVYAPLSQREDFRPSAAAVEQFIANDPRPRAVFPNSPHNPTGGVATADDVRELCDLLRGRDMVLFSDEPYDQMVWQGKHVSPLAEPNMWDQCLAAYTFSKSYSMSGWRLGWAATSAANVEVISRLLNTSLSCTTSVSQLAGAAALRSDGIERDETMAQFRDQVQWLAGALDALPEVRCLTPRATFYAFANVGAICNRLGITSHGLAMYLLEGADDSLGVACLGGECFGPAGGGFLRFSCAEPRESLEVAVNFLADAVHRTQRVQTYLAAHAAFRLAQPYEVA